MYGKNIGFLRCIIMESRFLNFVLVMEIVLQVKCMALNLGEILYDSLT